MNPLMSLKRQRAPGQCDRGARGRGVLLESATRASPTAGHAIVDEDHRRRAHARPGCGRGAAHGFTVPHSGAPASRRQASSLTCDVVLPMQTICDCRDLAVHHAIPALVPELPENCHSVVPWRTTMPGAPKHREGAGRPGHERPDAPSCPRAPAGLFLRAPPSPHVWRIHAACQPPGTASHRNRRKPPPPATSQGRVASCRSAGSSGGMSSLLGRLTGRWPSALLRLPYRSNHVGSPH